MKQKYIILAIILACIAIVGAVAAIVIACITAGNTGGKDATGHTAAATNPDTPKQIDLCGQQIDLDRHDMWERFDRELSGMTFSHASTMLVIKRANKLFPRMAPILAANAVPADLLYLACIESNLDQRAMSPAKAAGIWQFMPATAAEYGMEVGEEIDERYNLEKATDAACKMLKKAYQKYGNWENAMASYNAGQGRISGELEAQGCKSAFDLHLVSETSRYMFRVMAMKTIMENPRDFGFEIRAEQLYQPVEYTDVAVSDSVPSWPEWAARQGITYAQLVEANPWIRSLSLTNPERKTYTVKVPHPNALKRSKNKPVTFNPKWVAD